MLDFKKAYPRYDTEYYDGVIAKMLDCGHPKKMGSGGFRCFSYGHFHTFAMTYKSTFCLSCTKPYTDKWVNFIGRRLIPDIIYRHSVLIVSDFFRIYF